MKWELFGLYLLETNNNQVLTLIQQNEEGKPLVNKCRALLDLWKRRNAKPKWEQVINALKTVKLNWLATELEVALEQGQQGKVVCYMTVNVVLSSTQVDQI